MLTCIRHEARPPPESRADGNLEQDATWTYTWDAENRLREMVPGTAGNGKRLVFSYDYMGRRIRKRVFGWGGNAWDS